jgi:hypothetical protein
MIVGEKIQRVGQRQRRMIQRFAGDVIFASRAMKGFSTAK